MACNILVLNIGSTSFKFKYFNMNDESVIAEGKIGSVFTDKSDFKFCVGDETQEGIFDTTKGYEICLEKVIFLIDEKCEGGKEKVSAIGFKTVMAGEINHPCALTDEVLDKMEDLSLIAPAHNTPYINAAKIVKKIFPDCPVIGSFETAFHNTIEPYAAMYPIDKDLAQKYGIRKYGFHGAAHSFVSYKLSEKHEKIISVHLGGSSSVCAIKNGKSVDTSMGFSPQSGVAMNNRCGDVDIFSILYLMEKENMDIEKMRKFLSTKCGLLGMSKISNDMRDIENGNDKTVLDAYTYSVAKYISSYLASLGGVDAISFSGGIGENSIKIKKDILKRLKFLGIELDDEKIKTSPSKNPIEISKDTSKVKIYVTYADEELMVAKNTYGLLERR